MRQSLLPSVFVRELALQLYCFPVLYQKAILVHAKMDNKITAEFSVKIGRALV